MKHLHREKCSHLHLRVCAPKRVCPVCLQCDAEWKKRPNNNTHGNTDKQTHDTKNEKNECDVVTKVHEVHPVFYALFSFPSFCVNAIAVLRYMCGACAWQRVYVFLCMHESVY